MDSNDQIFNKIAEALLVDYSSVYYVDAVTNRYQWYSINPEYHSLQIEQGGDDFFKNMKRDAEKVVYEEDMHFFTEDIQKEHLMQIMKDSKMQSFEYRLMIDGKPVYHTLRMIREASGDGDYFIFGVLNIDEEVRRRQEAERIEREREIFNQISGSLVEHYDTLYYINIETNRYFEFSAKKADKGINISTEEKDFFEEAEKRIKRVVHPEDQEKFLSVCNKEAILKNLKNVNSYSMDYRRMEDDAIVYCRHYEFWARDKKHIILCIENINSEIEAKKALKESQKKSITYGQIAESLASHYDVIYYVDSENGTYTEYTAHSIYGNLEIQEEGNDFFVESQRNAVTLVHPEDRDRVQTVLGKDYLITALEERKQYSTDYRLMIDGQPQYTRLTVTWASDRIHFIIGVENITEEVLREKEHLRALRSANERAMRDELTGAKNKNAYQEYERSVQMDIDSGMNLPFAVLVCDLNNLKLINDSLGHKAGDEYIQAACKLICITFAHSPVFRIGGDEFVVVLMGDDFAKREELLKKLRCEVQENLETKKGPVVATGIATYDPEVDHMVSEIFERADGNMYENKKVLKAGQECR